MIKGAVFFDYDGTLVDEQSYLYELSPTTRQSIGKLRENGYLAILATGRAQCYVPPALDCFDGMVTTNGAYAQVHGEEILNDIVPDGELQALLSYFEEHGVNYLIENQTDAYCWKWDQKFIDFVTNFHIDTSHIHDMTHWNPDIKLNKLNIVYAPAELFGEIRARFGKTFDFLYHRGSLTSCDISRKGVSKANGVKAILDAFHIAPENAYAFGDNDNDLEMLEAVGHGIAMGKHSPNLEKVSEKITGTVLEEGIYTALVSYGLIDAIPECYGPQRLTPACKDYLWGGERLLTQYGKKSDMRPLAECWEVSTHPQGESTIADGPFAGLTLTKFTEDYPETLGSVGRTFPKFPMLIKLIDAAKPLSVQVHPNDEYAARVENEFGKTEMWHIMDAAPGSTLYFGVSRPVSREEFASRIADNTVEEVLRKVEVHPGDCFFIESGTLHAIGAGILLAEVQQNSNTTYRVYDYGRLGADGKPRELHIKKAMDVAELTPKPEQPAGEFVQEKGYRRRHLGKCRYFDSDCYEVEHVCALPLTAESFTALVMEEGNATLYLNGKTVTVKKGQSLYLPAQNAYAFVEGKCRFLTARV